MIQSKKAANILLVGTIVISLIFFHDYLGVIALAALTALLFTPLHNYLLRKGGLRARTATALTLFAVTLVLILPLITLTSLAFYQGKQAAANIEERNLTQDKEVSSVADGISQTADSLGLNISAESISQEIQSIAKNVVPDVVAFIFNTAENVAFLVTAAIVYITLLAMLLGRKYEVIAFLKRLSPFRKDIDEEFLTNIKEMAISMVKCTFLIAAIVGLISAATFWIIGLPFIAFWFILFTILSLIPLGACIIYVPIGVLLLLTGHTWEGILILAVQFIVLNNVDNVMRPRLAPKGTHIPGAFILLSTFAGVGFYGFIGVVYGPIIMVIIYTAVQLYLRHKNTGIPLKLKAATK